MKVNSSPKRGGPRKIQDFAKNSTAPAAVSAAPAPAPAAQPLLPITASPACSACPPAPAPRVG